VKAFFPNLFFDFSKKGTLGAATRQTTQAAVSCTGFPLTGVGVGTYILLKFQASTGILREIATFSKSGPFIFVGSLASLFREMYCKLGNQIL